MGAQLPAFILVDISIAISWCDLERWRNYSEDWVLCWLQLGGVDRHWISSSRRRNRRASHQLRRQHCQELCDVYFHSSELYRERILFQLSGDAIRKSFAFCSILGTDEEQFFLGTCVVLFATYLYTKPERGMQPSVPIADFEKTTVDRSYDESEYDAMPRTPSRYDGATKSSPESPTIERHSHKREA